MKTTDVRSPSPLSWYPPAPYLPGMSDFSALTVDLPDSRTAQCLGASRLNGNSENRTDYEGAK